MIQTKEDLRRYILEDNAQYLKLSWKERMIGAICRYPDYEIMRYKTYLRKAEYWFNTAKRGKLRFLMALFFERRKNILGSRLGIEIDINCFDCGLTLYHGGGIVVNPNARIGKNCALHGGNCIGNNGKDDRTPVIGDNADLGFGACVIGGVHLGNRIVIGCNSVVLRSCERDGAVLVGTPAKEVH